jgi:hypothetical protein
VNCQIITDLLLLRMFQRGVLVEIAFSSMRTTSIPRGVRFVSAGRNMLRVVSIATLGSLATMRNSGR